MKHIILSKNIFLVVASLIVLFISAQTVVGQEPEYQIKIKTNQGSFTVKLYNETPLHRDNFLKLVSENAYNNLLFHRVISNFMVQAGGAIRGNDSERYEHLTLRYHEMIPSEFRYPKYFHKRGALAAARKDDDVNPEKKSDPIEFYIVVGEFFLEKDLKRYESPENTMPLNVKETYMTQGGSPHLDNEYTVFGEVVDGYNTIEKISKREVDANNRPIKDIYIISTTILHK